MSVLILLLMLLLIVLGFPVAFAIVISTLVFFLASPDVTMEVLVQRLITGTQSFPLLAIPFFIITGYLMNASDISRRLIRLASSVMGSVRGGIGYTNITVNTLMAGMSGSSNADAAVLSKLLVEPMVDRGYNKAFATALTAGAALIAPIIPPSIGLIMYGFVAEVSIGKLFMAGILPGIVMAIGLFAVNAYVSKRENISKEMNHFSARELWSALKDAVLALLIPVIIVGGIRLGIMTPTESGAVAVVYSLLIGIFVYKKVKLGDIREVLKESVLLTSAVIIIVAASSAFSWILTWEQMPQQIAGWVLGLSDNPLVVLFLINVLLLIVGMFLEGTACIILLTPLLIPLVLQLGIDPIHFGIILVLNLTIGSITPPVGTVMFTTSAVTKTSIVDFVKEGRLIYLVLFLILMIVTYVPSLSLLLTKL